MSLKEQLSSDLKDAMRAKEVLKRDTVRAINTAIKQVEVDERIEADDAMIIKLIQKMIKQREEASSQYKDAGRMELAEKEDAEAEILKSYLPQQLNDSELEEKLKAIIANVGATSPKDMGKVMGAASKELAGIADGKRISECTKKLLS